MTSQTITLAPGDTLTVTAGAAGSITTPPPPGPGPTPGPTPTTPPSGVSGETMDWANPQRKVVALPVGKVLAIEFTTGNISSTNSLPHITVTEYQASPWARKAVLSETPGDFDHPIGGAPGSSMQGNTITAPFALGTGSGKGYYPVLELNKTYYLNIKTMDGPPAEDQCTVSVDLLKGAL